MTVPEMLSEMVGNSLLNTLIGEELDRLLPLTEEVRLMPGDTLHSPGNTVSSVYFPHDTAIALISPTESGGSAEAALVSGEGMIGLPLFLGSHTATNRALVLVKGSATRVKAQTFREEFCQSRMLRALLNRYTNAFLSETSRLAGCAQLHDVPKRFARWLLLLQDRVGSDEFRLTHETIGEMLGVRREGITAAAIKLQQRGIIRYKHGRINIVDRGGLEHSACECYELIRYEFEQLHIANLEEKVRIAKLGENHPPGNKSKEREVALESLREINSRLIVAAVREHAARVDAEEANTAKDEFLATLSHELRTPLTAMLRWSRILRAKETDNPAVDQALSVIESNARAQEQLIEELLEITRIIAGKLRLNIQVLNLNSVMDAAVEAARPAAETKDIQIQVSSGQKDVQVNGDASRLAHVLANLLVNAIRFTPPGGHIQVTSQQTDGEFVAIEVRDTGCGIDAEFLPFVFDRFRQSNTTTREHGGLGLGLAIARHLVELQGGKIKAESSGRDRGATFTVNLPRAGLLGLAAS
jgi:signal transduction histidine kinase